MLSRHKLEERKSRNQNFKATPAWIISSGKMESELQVNYLTGDLASFKWWSAAVNSLFEKVSEIFTGSGAVAFQRSDSSWETSRDDLRSTASYLPILTSWGGKVTRRVSWLTSKVVQNTPCFSTTVWKVNAPNCFGPSISPFPAKLGKQSCSTQTRVVSLRRLQKRSLVGFTLRIPAWNIVVSIPAWDSFLATFLMMLQEYWWAASTPSQSGGNKVFANLFVKAM